MEGARVQELVEKLENISKNRELRRFSSQEMLELLQDGEEVEWIVSQVLPEGSAEAIAELSAVLGEISAQVSPPPQEPAVAEAVPAEADFEWEEVEALLPPGVDRRLFRQLLDSPQGALMADFTTFCQEKGVSSEVGSQQFEEQIQELQEEWLHTPRPALEGRKPSEILRGGRLFPGKVETFRREAPKVGRNDPCPCGSGKKYKKCCGKGE